jgi:hypothetical protein
MFPEGLGRLGCGLRRVVHTRIYTAVGFGSLSGRRDVQLAIELAVRPRAHAANHPSMHVALAHLLPNEVALEDLC